MSPASSALITLYDSITNRYVFKLEVDGEVKELTRGELMVYVRGSRPRPARSAPTRSCTGSTAQDGPILGQMYQTLVRDWRNENVDLRQLRQPDRRPQPGQRHPRRGGRYPAGGRAERNAAVFQRFSG